MICGLWLRARAAQGRVCAVAGRARFPLVAFMLAVLAACGGGGGGGGGGGSGGGGEDFSVSTSTLVFSGTENNPPPPQNILATALTGAIYFDVSHTGPIFTNFSTAGAVATVVVQPQAMAPGTYSGTVTVKGYKDSLGLIPAAGSPKVVQVTYTVTSGVAASPSGLSFEQVSGNPAPAGQTLAISDTRAASYSWSASIVYQSGSGWLKLNGGDQAAGAGLPDSLNASIQTPASIGAYSATIKLVGGGRSIDVPVTLTYRAPQVFASPNSLAFDGVAGSPSAPASRQVTVTGDNMPWTVAADQPWVSLSTGGGTGAGTFDVSVDISGLASGLHPATVTVTPIGGTPQTVTLALDVEPRRLVVSADGVALTKTATIANLSRTLTVNENSGVSGNWNAVSDQSWLTVTPSGSTPGSLTLTADPSALAAEQIHYANVTVSSPDVSITNSETIRVGFYVSASTPLASQTTEPPELAVGATLISDPIRPYVYASTKFACNGGPSTSAIYVYNIHTGATVASLAGPAGAEFAELAVSTNGSRLYARDQIDGGIVPFDLDALVAGAKISPLIPGGCRDFAYSRVDGRGLLLTNTRQILDAASGADLGQFSGPANAEGIRFLAPSGDGKSLYAFGTLTTSFILGLDRYAMRYRHVQGTASVTHTHRVDNDFSLVTGNLGLAANGSGSRIYVANLNMPGIYQFDGTNLNGTPTLPGSGFLRTVRVGPTGKLYTDEETTPFSNVVNQVFVYDEDGAALGSVNLPISAAGKFVISGDGLRLLHVGMIPPPVMGNPSTLGLGIVTITP